jgi:NAD+ synthase (glutamine-hydrolysing)
MRNLTLAFGQTNPVVGDFDYNLAQIREQIVAAPQGTDLLVFGELAICGYPLGDLSYRRDIIEGSEKALQALVAFTESFPNLTIVVGHASHALVASSPQQSSFAIAHNSASVMKGGNLLGTYHKRSLPNYDVFDDWRNFVPGNQELVFDVAGTRCALAICEDIWTLDPSRAKELREAGVELLVVPNGSPFTKSKRAERLKAARNFQDGFAIAYANLSGGQDELVFDGGSFYLGGDGLIQFQADMRPGLKVSNSNHEIETDTELLWGVLVAGLRDYLAKTGQKQVVLGLSGGIDSALCAAIAVDAVGPENVHGVALPSRYSSVHSLSDAEALAKNLGLKYRTVEIERAHKAFEDTITLSDLASENIQSRIRAVILMGISNTEGPLLLTTGNKSEIAVGYSTMYGDSAGGFAPIKDLYKTEVWELSRWLNTARGREVIPVSSIEKAPSAELRPDQTDQDSLPEYPLLDAILERLIERSSTVSEIVQEGFDRKLVREVDSLVRKAEWKRSQGAIGTKVSAVAFGTGRRVPLTTRFETL